MATKKRARKKTTKRQIAKKRKVSKRKTKKKVTKRKVKKKVAKRKAKKKAKKKAARRKAKKKVAKKKAKRKDAKRPSDGSALGGGYQALPGRLRATSALVYACRNSEHESRVVRRAVPRKPLNCDICGLVLLRKDQ